jgi:hypothetical protein
VPRILLIRAEIGETVPFDTLFWQHLPAPTADKADFPCQLALVLYPRGAASRAPSPTGYEIACFHTRMQHCPLQNRSRAVKCERFGTQVRVPLSIQSQTAVAGQSGITI